MTLDCLGSYFILFTVFADIDVANASIDAPAIITDTTKLMMPGETATATASGSGGLSTPVVPTKTRVSYNGFGGLRTP